MSVKILVIIVTYNPMKWVDACIGQLLHSSYSLDVFVVDNGSKDGGQDYIKSKYPNVIFQQSESNLGFGKANNVGMKYALAQGYDYVYLLNQDAWIHDNTIEELIRISKDNPEYGILSPLQMEKTESRCEKIFTGAALSKTGILHENGSLVPQKLKDVYTVEHVQAAHWLITSKCLREIGGFSPTFPHYGEDWNYLQRLSYHGFKVGICPKLKVVHDCESRGVDMSKQAVAYRSYITGLSVISNPINQVTTTSVIKSQFVLFLKSFNPYYLRFAWNLFSKRKEIEQNKRTTMCKCPCFIEN